MEAAGVITHDYQLAYRLINALRSHGIRPVQLAPGDNIPASMSVWFGTPEEVRTIGDPRGIGCTVDNLEAAITSALVGNNTTIDNIVFGVDPGPRPGLAWISKNMILGSVQLESVDETANVIDTIVGKHNPKFHVVRIGNGSRTISGRIVNICLTRGHSVEIVDERKTSTGSRHNHTASAARIAMKPGRRKLERVDIDPSEGEIKEIQRRSRTTSGGRVTIPKSLAKAVAVGRMDIYEAVRKHDRNAALNHSD